MAQHDVVIVDVGISNLFNVKRAFERIGAKVLIADSRQAIMDAPRVLLPGVGAFGTGMLNLAEKGVIQALQTVAKSGRPFMGICLGMQMLFSLSEEMGIWDGLGIIPGKVRSLQMPQDPENRFKIPQISWNSLKRNERNGAPNDPWSGTILEGLEKSPYMYFVHSFYAEPENPEDCLALTFYGHDRFCSVVRKDNISGCQFHPERSGNTGMQILKNFLKQRAL